jgi:phosphatidylinositol-3-phosphatase
VAKPIEDENLGPDRGRTCPECGAARAPDQRYCLSCGTRLGSLPAAIALQLGRLRSAAAGLGAAALGAAMGAKPAEASEDGSSEESGWPWKRSDYMPSPRAAAVAVIGMLGLGVLLGQATGELAQSAGLSTILVEGSGEPPQEEPEAPAVEPEVESGGEAAEPVASIPAVPPAVVPPIEEPTYEEPETPEVPVDEELPTGLPEVKHVFVVMLGEGGYEETFGEKSESKYLKEELPAQGEVLSNYFAVTKGPLANQIALLSGQGPTAETAVNCPNYADVAPGTESAEGQIEGNGCVYPATAKSLFGQIEEAKLKWKVYVDGIEDGAASGQPISCRHPAVGSADPNPTATEADAYETWRNPAVYFHGVIDGSECGSRDVGLPQLSADLKLKADKFPALAYIAPDEDEAALKALIDEIKESLAYKDGGMLVITSTQASQEGEAADASACCISPNYPNTPEDESAAVASGAVRESGGGGRVGLVLLSPFVEAGTTSETYFNHYSLLVTIEELFGLERIGYAAEPALVGFDESIFNAGS